MTWRVALMIVPVDVAQQAARLKAPLKMSLSGISSRAARG